jgi:hypothetical protein
MFFISMFRSSFDEKFTFPIYTIFISSARYIIDSKSEARSFEYMSIAMNPEARQMFTLFYLVLNLAKKGTSIHHHFC